MGRKGDGGKLRSTTGLGKADCPGWEEGFAETWTVEVDGEGVIRGHFIDNAFGGIDRHELALKATFLERVV